MRLVAAQPANAADVPAARHYVDPKPSVAAGPRLIAVLGGSINMANTLDLLQQLAALTSPSVALIQSLLGAPLSPLPDHPSPWALFEAKPATGAVALVDYRVPPGDPATKRPLLNLKLRQSDLTLDDLREHYGVTIPTDVSVHHPDYVGYSFLVEKRCVSAYIHQKDSSVMSFHIDYSRPPVEGRTLESVAKACDVSLHQGDTPMGSNIPSAPPNQLMQPTSLPPGITSIRSRLSWQGRG